MICCILMLSSLVSSVWGTVEVKVAQSSYQAEEDGDVTLEWTFTTTAHSSSDSLFIYCSLLTDHKVSVLLRLYKGVEVPESQDKQFSGRVQWDTDVLREGRLRLHVSRLRTNDSGVYQCDVSTGYGGSSDSCDLNVTGNFNKCQLNVTASDQPQLQRPTRSPHPPSEGIIALYTALVLAAVAVMVPVLRAIIYTGQWPRAVGGENEDQPIYINKPI